jgi:hypothetical protein
MKSLFVPAVSSARSGGWWFLPVTFNLIGVWNMTRRCFSALFSSSVLDSLKRSTGLLDACFVSHCNPAVVARLTRGPIYPILSRLLYRPNSESLKTLAVPTLLHNTETDADLDRPVSQKLADEGCWSLAFHWSGIFNYARKPYLQRPLLKSNI